MDLQNNMTIGYPHITKPWIAFYKKNQDPSVPAQSIYDFLLECTKNDKTKTAITYYGSRIYYETFLNNIDTAARILSFCGVKQGDRVLYLIPNIPESAYLLYAGAKIGAVSDYIDPRPESIDAKISAKKVLAIIEREKITHIVSLDMCYPHMLFPIEKELSEKGIGPVIIVSAGDSMNKRAFFSETRRIYGWKKAFKQASENIKTAKALKSISKNSVIGIKRYSELALLSKDTPVKKWSYEKNTTAVIVHTSGTSGTVPKPIPLTHENMNMHVKSLMASRLRFTHGMRHMQLLPLFAAFGVATGGHMVWCSCCDQIMLPDFSPDKLSELITYYRPNGICMLPSWCSMLHSSENNKKIDFSSLVEMVYGGDIMEPDEEARINRLLSDNGCKIKLSKGHGMSETCGASSYGNDECCEPGSMGIPCPYVTYAVLSIEDFSPLAFTEGKDFIEGIAAISGPTVTPGVLDGTTVAPCVKIHGKDYIITDDNIRMDRQGRMTFIGRNSRCFTRYDGYKIKPYELEDLLKKSESIVNCVIVPFKDNKKGGNMPRAFIVPKNGMPESREEAVRFIRECIDSLFLNNHETMSRQIPSSFRFISRLPLTENGKTDYKKLEYAAPENNDISVLFEETAMSMSRVIVL